MSTSAAHMLAIIIILITCSLSSLLSTTYMLSPSSSSSSSSSVSALQFAPSRRSPSHNLCRMSGQQHARILVYRPSGVGEGWGNRVL
eukprot:3931922-Rhodomonas_salina.1